MSKISTDQPGQPVAAVERRRASWWLPGQLAERTAGEQAERATIEVNGVRSSWLTIETNSALEPVHLASLGDVAKHHDRAADLVLPLSADDGQRVAVTDRNAQPVGRT